MTTPLIIDCDTGIDDSLALLYACASPDAEIVAVTCVAGNVDARQVAENTRAVLELAGRSDIEVALGRETPLVRPLMTTPETHGPRGIGYAQLPATTTAGIAVLWTSLSRTAGSTHRATTPGSEVPSPRPNQRLSVPAALPARIARSRRGWIRGRPGEVLGGIDPHARRPP